MSLAAKLGLSIGQKNVIFVGRPEISGITDSNNEPYYFLKLKEPQIVRCSVNADIDPIEVDEVLVRESALSRDDWQYSDKDKPELGFWIPDWVLDFSPGQQQVIYQNETIRQWRKSARGIRKVEHASSINHKIQSYMANRKKS